MINQLLSLDPGPDTLLAFRYWIHGFAIQTIIYGINVVLFLMTTWVLGLHIFKGLRTNRFHRHHLFQNSILLSFTITIFTFSTVYMGHQGIVTADAWTRFLQGENIADVPIVVFKDRAALVTACSAVSVLVNWGTVSILLWRCTIHWKIQSVFPSEVMALPYATFALCIATTLLRLVQISIPGSMPASVMQRDWNVISWGVATALYYLLSLLIAIRVVYHRRWIQKQIGDRANLFTGYLTIFNESSPFVLIFTTVHLVILTKFRYLEYLSLASVVQIQVTSSLVIIQRLTVGRAWSGKSIDCILHKEPKHEAVYKHEEVSTIGFTPNTEISLTENDQSSERSNKKHDLIAVGVGARIGPV